MPIPHHVVMHMDEPDQAVDAVAARFPNLTVSGWSDYDGLAAHLNQTGADVVFSVRFGGTHGFPRAALVESGVQWVSVGGSGTDHLAGWDPERVTVTNSAGVAADMMAEYTVGALLHFSLNLPGFRRAQAARVWGAGRVRPIEGQTALIIGLGPTGQAVAKRAKAMGMHVLGLRARPQPTAHVDEILPTTALMDTLPRADAVVLCVPLLDSTRNLLSADAIAAMKPGAVLVDVSRGGVADQTALASALQDGQLRGAALDVFETEPLPASSPFWDMENVIVTPHCSSVYDGWQERSVRMFCDNLERYISDKPLSNVVDPARGY